jgi:DNA-binding XRE family transcriptional regulator
MKNWRAREIKELRARYKLSRPALGRLIGVSGNYIYMLERGDRNASKTLKLLLDCMERERKRKGE